ncbi:MAG: hypothetical protein AAFP98_06545 [Pseudomonadota bacterium]
MGHYGAAFAAKAVWPEAPLPALMLSTQIMDVAFCAFVGAGIEKIEITKQANPTVPIRSNSIPYSHGFESAIIYSILCAVGASLIYGDLTTQTLWVIGLICLSHWFIDLIVHTGDLPILFGRRKVGFGLWNYRSAAIGLEFAVIILGIVALASAGVVTAWKVWVVGALMLGLQMHTNRAEPPASIVQLLASMMTVFVLMTLLGVWLEAP